MSSFLTNNIFTNPRGWAEKTIGSLLRYRLMQSLSVALGFCLAGILFLIWEAEHYPLAVYFAVLVFLFVAVVQLPLCYLRALRSYVVQSQAVEPRK